MDEKTAKEIIEKAFQFRETELDLSGWGLEELPREIGKLVWLEKLNLESAGITILPKEIGLLTNLRELNLFDNRLESLPAEIGNLISLEYLDFSSNLHFIDLPLEFANLTNLQRLDFDDNNFGHFPFAITKLINLRVLHIMGNQIEYLPAEIGNLTHLEELDININMLTSLPVEFGTLSRLKTLDISRNYLPEIPNALFNLSSLVTLYIGENYVKTISPKIGNLKSMKFLSFGNSGEGLRYWAGSTEYNNEISNLPIEITRIENLQILDLRRNPLPVSPEILEKIDEPVAIFNAYFGERPLAPKRNLSIFLCHSSNDKTQVRKLYKKLTSNSMNVWLDEENLIPGQDWEYEISKAIDTSDVIIVCLSKNSVSKEGFVQKEIRFALDKAEEKPEGVIFIIPLLLEECEVPQRLSKRHWAKLYEENGYSFLLKALNVRAINLGLK
jgi:Leucine-rich repeat (LRR) protein